MRRFFAIGSCAALLSACAGGVASSPQTGAAPGAAMRPASTGNIYWSKGKLHLAYPPHGKKSTVLNFWGPDGYSLQPLSCQNNSKIAITHGKVQGDPSGDEHVVYTFRAKSAGPDTCALDAVLDNTGSPPIAILHLVVGS